MKVITIGRAQGSNDIVVSDEKVSRHHLQLIIDDFGNVKVNDMGSTNGTFVNGTRIMGESQLIPNDQLRIGDTVLPWQSFVDAAKPPVPPAQPMPPQQPTYVPPQPPQQPPLPPNPRRRRLIIALSLLGVILTGVIVWRLLSGPKTNQPTNTSPRSDSVSDLIKEDMVPGVISDKEIEETFNEIDKIFERYLPSVRLPGMDKKNATSKRIEELRAKGYKPDDIKRIIAGEDPSKFTPEPPKEGDNNTPTTKDKSTSLDDGIKGALNSQQPPQTPTTKKTTTTPTPDNSQKSNNTGTQPSSTNGKPSKSGVNLHGKTQNPNNGEKLKNDQANTHTAPTI